ncbi:MAG: flagellar assembly protein T N-terminal domain-containing protein [Succinivibrionaceae bacterium]|nr:flagellar assembly protein T N-terminal domain-containing protein [Succinivibrionaceae bacterium]
MGTYGWRRGLCAMAALLALTLSPLGALAAWHEAQGSGSLSHGAAAARDEAIAEALRGLLVRLGETSSPQVTVRNGQVVSASLADRMSSPIKALRVTEESVSGNRVTVRVKVLMDEGAIESCALSQVRKGVQPLAFTYRDYAAQQGAVGMDQINEEIGRRIISGMGETQALAVKPQMRGRIALDPRATSTGPEVRRNLDALARQKGVQYVVTGEVLSVSRSETGSNPLTSYLYRPTRGIAFRVQTLDTHTGEVAFTRDYSGEADWDFKQGEYIDLRSERFWGSGFGMKVQELCRAATRDLVALIQCEATRARIVEVSGESVVVSVGSDAGIKRGMQFSASHRMLLQAHQNLGGEEYRYTHEADTLFKVVDVYPHAARLMPVSPDRHLLDLAVGDVVELR